MVGTRMAFTREQAPCGRIVDGEHFRDEDDQGLVINDEYYACGCRHIRHDYHDGSCHTRTIRHDGRVVEDKFGADHGC
jgi:hypothetical protein